MALAYRLAGERVVPAIVGLVESAYRGEPSRAGWTTEEHLPGGQRTDAEAVLAAARARERDAPGPGRRDARGLLPAAATPGRRGLLSFLVLATALSPSG